MKARLDPEVLNQAKASKNLTSDEKLAAQLHVTGATIRNWRKGTSTPRLESLVRLQHMTGRPYGTMLIVTGDPVAA